MRTIYKRLICKFELRSTVLAIWTLLLTAFTLKLLKCFLTMKKKDLDEVKIRNISPFKYLICVWTHFQKTLVMVLVTNGGEVALLRNAYIL